MISDFEVSCFKSISYELRLGAVQELVGSSPVPQLKELRLPCFVKPGEYLVGRSVESLSFPDNLLGILVPTSFAIRIGLGVNCGKVDPTYKGKVSFGIFNLTKRAIKLEKNMRLVHLLVSEFKGEIVPLETKYFGGTV